jgi:hypothetical protein
MASADTEKGVETPSGGFKGVRGTTAEAVAYWANIRVADFRSAELTAEAQSATPRGGNAGERDFARA